MVKKGLFFGALLLVLVIGATEPYRVMLLGDLHYDAPQYHTPGTFQKRFANYPKMWQHDAPDLLAHAASHVDETFSFVIQLGDIANGYTDSMEHQEAILGDAFDVVKKYFPKHPLLVVKGNHDVRVILDTKEVDRNEPAARAFLPRIAKEADLPELATGNFAVVRHNDLYLFVDGFDKSADTVKFVKETLAAHPDARYVFLITHLPIFPTSYKRPNWLLPHYAEIARLLAKRNGIVLGGHTHNFALVSHEFAGAGRVTQLIVNSVAIHWQKPGEWLPKTRSYPEFSAAMNKLKKPYRFEKEFPASGYREYLIYPKCPGYAVLEISDEKVVAKIYSGAGNPPYELLLQTR